MFGPILAASSSKVVLSEYFIAFWIVTDELDRLASLYSRARSADVQRAIAEVFLRSDLGAIDTRALVERLQRDRVGRDGLVDTLIDRLQPS